MLWGVLAALLALAAAFCLVFDWNWCRPLMQHYVMSHSGRRIDFADLQVHFRHGLDPTFEFRGLTIENAPWAATKAPFVRAGRLAATLSWRSLRTDMTVIDLLELEDAQVDMERRADGVRNWRLSHPDDRGPPRLRVRALDGQRSSVHTLDASTGLEAQASLAPLPVREVLASHPERPLTKRLAFQGHIKGETFEGAAQVSDVLYFGDPGHWFGVRLDARAGAVRIEASGLSDDAHALGDIDCDVRLSATGTGAIAPLPAGLAHWRPLVVEGRVAKTGDRWNGSGLRVRAGRGTRVVVDAVFVGSLERPTPRRTLKATVRDGVVDIGDLAPAPASARRGDAADGPALSTRPLPVARLRTVDADVEVRPLRLVGGSGLARSLQGLSGRARLAGGVLRLQALEAEMAGGHVGGTLQVDAAKSPADVAADLRLRGLRLDQLSPALAANGALAGAVDGRVSLKSRGDSTRALAGAARGEMDLSLEPGASVSRRVDAKLGLNGGEWLRTLFDKSARVPVQCAQATFAVDHGVASLRRLVFETPATALAARGSVNVVDETLDATLTPAHKKTALLSLDKSIHVQGPWRRLKFSLAPAGGDAPARCGP